MIRIEHPPVVTGLAVMSGAAHDAAGLATALRAGRGAIGPLAPGELPGLMPRLGAVLRGFDPVACLAGLGPAAAKAARGGSRSLIAGLAVALDAARDAGLTEAAGFGVVVAGSNLASGSAWAAAAKFRANPAHTAPRHGYEWFDTHLGSVVAEILGARGPSLSVGGASASGNSAVAMACDLIALGRAPGCVVVAPLPDLSPLDWQALAMIGALAPSQCRPFDRRAEGFVAGEACAALVIEAAGHAKARGARSRAAIAGSALLQDGRHGTAPDAAGEYRTMTTALDRAGIDASALGYVSAHATGTPAGDEAEARALTRLLGASARVPVNATKSLLGHSVQAAGLVELVATILQLEGGFIHPTLGLDEPISDALWLVAGAAIEQPVEWALSNAFGFGGITTSVVIRNGAAEG